MKRLPVFLGCAIYSSQVRRKSGNPAQSVVSCCIHIYIYYILCIYIYILRIPASMFDVDSSRESCLKPDSCAPPILVRSHFSVHFRSHLVIPFRRIRRIRSSKHILMGPPPLPATWNTAKPTVGGDSKGKPTVANRRTHTPSSPSLMGNTTGRRLEQQSPTVGVKPRLKQPARL